VARPAAFAAFAALAAFAVRAVFAALAVLVDLSVRAACADAADPADPADLVDREAAPPPASLAPTAALVFLTVGEATPFVAAFVVARAARAAVPPGATAFPFGAGTVTVAACPSWEVSSVRSRERGWVSQATAAPVTATGHSTTPARPSTPAPVYTTNRRPRGDTAPTLSSAPPATRVTLPPPGTFRSTEAAVRSGKGRLDDLASAMVHLAYAKKRCGSVECPHIGR
jgi:hypothetical protein